MLSLARALPFESLFVCFCFCFFVIRIKNEKERENEREKEVEVCVFGGKVLSRTHGVSVKSKAV